MVSGDRFSYWNVGRSAKNVWPVKTGGLSWECCLKKGFTVPTYTKYVVSQDRVNDINNTYYLCAGLSRWSTLYNYTMYSTCTMHKVEGGFFRWVMVVSQNMVNYIKCTCMWWAVMRFIGHVIHCPYTVVPLFYNPLRPTIDHNTTWFDPKVPLCVCVKWPLFQDHPEYKTTFSWSHGWS